MGSPLAHVLGDMFMGLYESKWLNEYNEIMKLFIESRYCKLSDPKWQLYKVS